MTRKRLGIVGFGYIGSYIYDQITKRPDLGLDVAFVNNRSPERLENVPRDIVLDDLSDFATRTPDMVIEMAHPSISATYANAILSITDYMMLSVTAMADSHLSTRLIETSRQHGTSLFIPHGALIGVDNLWEGHENWAEVTITFRKHPRSMDFSAAGLDPADITSETVVYDGSVRGAAAKFPRNVNTMATCALASLGFDNTRGVVIVDPSLSTMSAEVIAVGKDGSLLETKKVEQAVGVSGTGMLASQLASIRRAALGAEPGLTFV